MSDELRRLDDFKLGQLTQAIETLTEKVNIMDRRMDDMQAKMNKSTGFAIGILMASGGIGAGVATFFNNLVGK